MKTSLTFPLADRPPGPVQELEAPTAPRAGRASCQRASPTLALCALSLFLPDPWSPGTVPLDGTSVGQGFTHQGLPFLCTLHFMAGGFVEKPKQADATLGAKDTR